tara:strand:+ start:125665 stop:127146 length:1482 start_codon:yes stop_codon:yes gene_type:complete
MLDAAVNTFLDTEVLEMYIGGDWESSRKGETFAVQDPGTGKHISSVYAGDETDVELAVSAAEAAFVAPGWATLTTQERAKLLHGLADLIEKNAEILSQIESLDSGKPRAQAAEFDIPFGAQTFRYYADLALSTKTRNALPLTEMQARTVGQPYGPCGFIIPWNFPFLLAIWGIAPALAAGNTVVIKPAEDTSLSTLYLAKLAEEAGFPPGVINVVTGFGHTAGAALAGHPRIKRMAFTGSTATGRVVARQCGENLVPVKLELGGKGAAVVFDDVDVDHVVDSLCDAIVMNAGQVCCTATRWLVHESIFDRFMSRAVDRLSALKVGYGADSDTDIGPVVNVKQRDRIVGYWEQGLHQGGSAILAGGAAQVGAHPDGYYVKPSIMTGETRNVCAQEEIFGPAAFAIPFKDEAQAIGIVNESDYGLANSVWTNDGEKADRVAESLSAGNNWINGHNILVHGVPYGGWNSSGCGGGVLGEDAYLDYLKNMSIVRNPG